MKNNDTDTTSRLNSINTNNVININNQSLSSSSSSSSSSKKDNDKIENFEQQQLHYHNYNNITNGLTHEQYQHLSRQIPWIHGIDASTLPNIAYIQPSYKHLWRKGKWTEEEEVYTKKLIEVFNAGYLIIPSGTTLRSFLSEKLCCDPMRITKKFSGSSCIGKQVYNCCDPSVTKEVIQDAQDQLAILEKNFLSKVEQFGPSAFPNTAVPQYTPTPTYPVSAQAAALAAALHAHSHGAVPPFIDNIPEYLAIAQQLNSQITNAYFAGPIPAPFLPTDTHQGRLVSGPFGYEQNLLSFNLKNRVPSPSQLSGGESNDHSGDDVAEKSSDGGAEKGSDSGGEKISDNGGEKSSDSGVEKISDDGGKQSTGSTTSEDFTSVSSSAQNQLGQNKIDIINTSINEGELKRVENINSHASNQFNRVPLSQKLDNPLNVNSLKRRRPANDVNSELFKIPNNDMIGDYRFGIPPQVFGFDPYMMRYQDIYNQPGTWSRNQARIELANAQAAAATSGASVRQVDLDASHLLLNFFKTAQPSKDNPNDDTNREADDTRSTSSEGDNNQPSVRSSSNTPADSSDASSDVDSNETDLEKNISGKDVDVVHDMQES